MTHVLHRTRTHAFVAIPAGRTARRTRHPAMMLVGALLLCVAAWVGAWWVVVALANGAVW